jgi:hypothetical protein
MDCSCMFPVLETNRTRITLYPDVLQTTGFFCGVENLKDSREGAREFRELIVQPFTPRYHSRHHMILYMKVSCLMFDVDCGTLS